MGSKYSSYDEREGQDALAVVLSRQREILKEKSEERVSKEQVVNLSDSPVVSFREGSEMRREESEDTGQEYLESYDTRDFDENNLHIAKVVKRSVLESQ